MEKQKLQIQAETIGLNDTFIMPTHRELIKARDFNIPVIFNSPYAVFIRKITKPQKHLLTNSLDIDKETIQEICGEFDKDFFVNFQFAKGVNFSDDELNYMEEVQQVEKLKRICMNEKSEQQTAKEFQAQLQEWKDRNNRKLLVPILDPATNELLKKISIIKKGGLKECGVIFRGFTKEEDQDNLNIILQNLRAVGISSVVFGVFPRKNKKSKASMLLPPLQFRANVVSPYFPWGGGKTDMELICADWLYRLVSDADSGQAEYESEKRKEILESGNNKVLFNTALGQIDTIHQANLMAQSFAPLPEIRFKRLFN